MGNELSVSEKVYRAVQNNDVSKFEALLKQYGKIIESRLGTTANLLSGLDSKGRSLLCLAAGKNFYHIARQLINLGCEVNFINKVVGSLGTPLHEAAARKHEALVELLLQSGANPFLCNVNGQTAIETAVLANSLNIVRQMETKAYFSGPLNVEKNCVLGTAFALRWAVVVPFYECPALAARSGAQPNDTPRLSLWLFKNRQTTVPKCRVWLVDARIAAKPSEGNGNSIQYVMKLSSAHRKPPGNVTTTFHKGFCLTLKPADTPDGAAFFPQLMQAVNQPNTLKPLVWATNASSASSTNAAPSARSKSNFSASPPSRQPSSTIAAAGAGGPGALNQAPSSIMSHTVSSVSEPPSGRQLSATAGSSAPPQSDPAPRKSAVSSGAAAPKDAAVLPSAPSLSASKKPQDSQGGNRQGLPSPSKVADKRENGESLNNMAADPGESDEAFARRFSAVLQAVDGTTVGPASSNSCREETTPAVGCTPTRTTTPSTNNTTHGEASSSRSPVKKEVPPPTGKGLSSPSKAVAVAAVSPSDRTRAPSDCQQHVGAPPVMSTPPPPSTGHMLPFSPSGTLHPPSGYETPASTTTGVPPPGWILNPSQATSSSPRSPEGTSPMVAVTLAPSSFFSLPRTQHPDVAPMPYTLLPSYTHVDTYGFMAAYPHPSYSLPPPPPEYAVPQYSAKLTLPPMKNPHAFLEQQRQLYEQSQHVQMPYPQMYSLRSQMSYTVPAADAGERRQEACHPHDQNTYDVFRKSSDSAPRTTSPEKQAAAPPAPASAPVFLPPSGPLPVEPSAPPLALSPGPGTTPAPSRPPARQMLDGEGELCVVCQWQRQAVGFLHGGSVHKCVCEECAKLFAEGSDCPLCRQAIERVIHVY